jgi:DNA-binding NarL/FixJ family response regulator
MTLTSLHNGNFEHSRSASHGDAISHSSVHHPVQADSINHIETVLTKRELEVLQLLADGYSNAVIAQTLYITMNTVKTHIRNILSKLYVSDRTQAVSLGFRSGLIN